MLRPRITPCLLVHNGGLVKTVRFGAPQYVGDPLNAVKIFNEKEADELIVLDIDASVHGSEPNYRLIANLAVECRMPLCYGGGIKTAEQVKRIVGLGVEKVSISSAAIENPSVIGRMAEEVGSQSVTVVFDVRRSERGYEVWTHNGSRDSGKLLDEVVRLAESLGAGEILVNSIDNDGQMTGYDLGLAKCLRELTSLPMTVLGGAGSVDDIRRLIETCGVVGAAAGSLFVFKGPYRAVLINYLGPTLKEDLFRALAPAPVGHL